MLVPFITKRESSSINSFRRRSNLAAAPGREVTLVEMLGHLHRRQGSTTARLLAEILVSPVTVPRNTRVSVAAARLVQAEERAQLAHRT